MSHRRGRPRAAEHTVSWGMFPGLIVELLEDRIAWSFMDSHCAVVDERGIWSFDEVRDGPAAARIREQLGAEVHAQIIAAIATHRTSRTPRASE